VNVQSSIGIDVGNREEKLHALHVQTRLLLHFASHALFACLVAVAEAAGKVECPEGRLLGASHGKELVLVVHDDGYGRGTRVEIIDEAAVFAPLALEVVLDEPAGAANGAVAEFR